NERPAYGHVEAPAKPSNARKLSRDAPVATSNALTWGAAAAVPTTTSPSTSPTATVTPPRKPSEAKKLANSVPLRPSKTLTCPPGAPVRLPHGVRRAVRWRNHRGGPFADLDHSVSGVIAGFQARPMSSSF